MSIANLKAQCLEEIERAYRIVEDKYDVVLPRSKVIFSNRMTKCGGTASYTTNRMTGEMTAGKITLSLPLLKLNGERFVMDTPAHEAMHLATVTMWNYAGHGPKWKGLMRLVGRSQSRTHTMETPAKRNTVLVHCNCQEHQLGKVRYKRMMSGAQSYRCNKCGGDLQPGPRPGHAVEENVIQEAPRPTRRTDTSKPKPRLPLQTTSQRATDEQLADAIAKLKAKGIQLSMVKGSKQVHEHLAKKLDISADRVRNFMIQNWAIIK